MNPINIFQQYCKVAEIVIAVFWCCLVYHCSCSDFFLLFITAHPPIFSCCFSLRIFRFLPVFFTAHLPIFPVVSHCSSSVFYRCLSLLIFRFFPVVYHCSSSDLSCYLSLLILQFFLLFFTAHLPILPVVFHGPSSDFSCCLSLLCSSSDFSLIITAHITIFHVVYHCSSSGFPLLFIFAHSPIFCSCLWVSSRNQNFYISRSFKSRRCIAQTA